jgi:SAM-dependent methyltransferase
VSDTASISEGYSRTAAAWRDGPGRIYNRLATELLRGVEAIAGTLALDLGAGTGAASSALQCAGARVVACDLALGMLTVDQATRPPATAADALALPFRDNTFDFVVAAFSLNHLARADLGLREAARVTRRGGRVLASAYALTDAHPVKEAADRAALAFDWKPPAWQGELRSDAMPLLATVDSARVQLQRAALLGDVQERAVDFSDLRADDLIEWRLGMAHLAPFVQSLSTVRRQELVARVRTELGEATQPLVRRMIVITVHV